MATTPLSAFASHGWSGGASGSSQSPNWKPLSHRPLGESSDSTRRTWAAMDVVLVLAAPSRSPYACHSAHGTHTAASLQIAAVLRRRELRRVLACT